MAQNIGATLSLKAGNFFTNMKAAVSAANDLNGALNNSSKGVSSFSSKLSGVSAAAGKMAKGVVAAMAPRLLPLPRLSAVRSMRLPIMSSLSAALIRCSRNHRQSCRAMQPRRTGRRACRQTSTWRPLQAFPQALSRLLAAIPKRLPITLIRQ